MDNFEQKIGPEAIEAEFIQDFHYQTENRPNCFPQIVSFHGRSYDLRQESPSQAVYRMTNEARIHDDEASYLEIDSQGKVIKKWN